MKTGEEMLLEKIEATEQENALLKQQLEMTLPLLDAIALGGDTIG